MYQVRLLNVNYNTIFEKWFYSYEKLRKFKNKVKYSKKIKILDILDWSVC